MRNQEIYLERFRHFGTGEHRRANEESRREAEKRFFVGVARDNARNGKTFFAEQETTLGMRKI